MARFVIILFAGSEAAANCASAYHFVQACLAKQHQISSVFLYQEAVHLTQAVDIPADEVNWPQRWQQLAQQHGFPIHQCVNAAARRATLTQSTSTDVGLGQLMAEMHTADRVISFG